MKENWVCVFCNKDADRMFKEKGICNICFNEIHDWSKNSKIIDEFNKIEKLIMNHINKIER